MGSRSRPHRVLSVCVCVCVSRCLWVRVIEANSLQLRVITIGLYQFLSRSLSCQILAVFAVVVYRSVLVPRFLSPAASWTPIAGPLAAHCFPALPASALRKAQFLPTESSASALRKAPFLPTESSASALRKAPFCLRKAPPLPTKSSCLVSRCVFYFL